MRAALEKSVSNLLRKQFNLTDAQYDAFRAFAASNQAERLKIARQIIIDSIINATEAPDFRFGSVIEESESLLKGYATLDEPHRAEIKRLIHHITDYLR